jgi:hypothetical protein
MNKPKRATSWVTAAAIVAVIGFFIAALYQMHA